MAKPKQVPSGRWALSLHHPSLPGGRKYFTFETEAEAIAYQQQWQLMRMSDLALPAELTSPTPAKDVRVSRILADWEHSGFAAKTQELTLRTVAKELGGMKLSELSYRTLNDYLRTLKVKQNLSPCSIKHRMQALSRALDEYARNHPKLEISNPVKMLPRGYSTYNDVDSKLVVEAGGKPKKSEWRDRRLKPGEEEKILGVMSGEVTLYKSRGLSLKGGDALRVMFLLIVNTGLRLSEAFLLKRASIDMDRKIITAKCSKQWRGKVMFRDVPIKPELFTVLQAYIAQRKMLPGAWFFPFMDEDGGITQRICSSRLSARFTNAFHHVGLTDLTEHDLRHEATCRWLELKDVHGRDMFRLEELNKIMGWTPGSVMAQRYASFRAEDLGARLWASAGPVGPVGSSAAA